MFLKKSLLCDSLKLLCMTPARRKMLRDERREMYEKRLTTNTKSMNAAQIAALQKEAGGADGITAINTLIGMAIDWRRRRPVLARGIGGLSGPAIRPVAVRMVWEIARSVSIPVIGVGGIQTASDVMEFLCAGAAAVQVGTAQFTEPDLMARLVAELEGLLRDEGVTVDELRGSALPAEVAGPGRAGQPGGGG